MAFPCARRRLHRVPGPRLWLAPVLLCIGLGAVLPATWGAGLLGVVPPGSATPASGGNAGNLAPSDRESIRRWSQEQRNELGGTTPPGAAANGHGAAAGDLTPAQRKVLREQIRAQQRWAPGRDGSAR